MDYSKQFPDIAKLLFARLPKEGEPDMIFTISKIEKAISKSPKFHNFEIKKKITLPDGKSAETTEDLGYYIKITLENGQELSLNSLFYFQKLFVGNNVQEGETIKISHPSKGVWNVTRVAKEVQLDEAPF